MTGSRRDFLQRTLAASTLLAFGPTAPAFLARTAQAAAARRGEGDTALVVVQLAGGNDGLNTVVPYEDDHYARARPTLRLPAASLHKIDEHLGFHPKMRAFHRLYREGTLAVLQGVGYPNPQQGHFEAMHVWQTARLESRESQTGWLGRSVDAATPPDDAAVRAVFVGEIQPPFTLNAQRTIVPAIRAVQDAELRQPPGAAGHARAAAEAARLPRGARENPLAAFLQRSALAAYAQSGQIEAAVRKQASNPAAYPPFELAARLRTIAQLLRADLGLRIFYTELGGQEPGGFDTHAGQAANHGALLEQLCESVAAFADDLKRDKLLDRVLVMTFSEFGRTVQENGRRGTDHGSAAPLFLVGGRVKGGLVGRHPNCTDLEGGGQRHHTDFRRVYATALDRWLGFDSRPVLGASFTPLDLLRPV
jgi:uncharacterized protein (DUF1501 family)